MSTTTPNPQAAEPTPAQRAALREAEAAVASLTERLRTLRDATTYDLEAAGVPLAHATDKLAEIQELQYKVQQLAASPERDYAATALKIQQRLWEGTGAMIEAQIACDRHNAEVFDKALAVIEACEGRASAWVQLQEQGLLGDRLPTRAHEDDVAYLRGRAQMNLFLGLHLWLANVDGIDGILRATGNGTAVEPRTEAEAAGRERVAEAFRAAMAAEPALAQLLGGLGADLAEAFTYLEWAAPLLKAIAAMPPEMQAKRLADPDWKRLGGQVQLIAGLIPKVQAFPAIARFFPAPRDPRLPFDLPAPPAAVRG